MLGWMQEFLDTLQRQNTCYTRICSYKAVNVVVCEDCKFIEMVEVKLLSFLMLA
jgi:hypothetical protein